MKRIESWTSSQKHLSLNGTNVIFVIFYIFLDVASRKQLQKPAVNIHRANFGEGCDDLDYANLDGIPIQTPDAQRPSLYSRIWGYVPAICRGRVLPAGSGRPPHET
jgi:hypothetical protein